MKKITSVLLISVLAVSALFANGVKEESVSGEKVYKIGISKFVAHPALDAIEQGIMDELNEMGLSYEFDLQNCNAEISTGVSIANIFKDGNKDLVIGIATPPAQALAVAFNNTDTPVEFAAITDPLSAGFMDEGLSNIFGISDRNPIELQLDTFIDLASIETLGMIYSGNESNGVAIFERAQQYCIDNGLELVAVSVSNSAEVKTAMLSIASRVDGIYIGNDNTVVSAIASVDQVCTDYDLPLFNSDTTSSENTNFLMSFGLDYYKVGRISGNAAYKVLTGTSPNEIGTVFLDDITQFNFILNLDRAEELNIEISPELLAKASFIVQDGSMIEN
ncbi:MAG: ABC transporter substrate-binding protein [Sphaerochaetaceae bacterium]|nr:ABC transporter substrate-binding protein [Sphaerochaetaceae bacterium]